MEQKMVTDKGTCYASLKTREEIQAIQSGLWAAGWLSQTARWLEAVKDPTRFKIVYLLNRYDRLCGCDLANILEITNSAVSQHIRKLKDMGLVSYYRHKQTLFYTLCQADFIVFFCQLVPSEEVCHERIEIRA